VKKERKKKDKLESEKGKQFFFLKEPLHKMGERVQGEGKVREEGGSRGETQLIVNRYG
jgi:hypothetical protein